MGEAGRIADPVDRVAPPLVGDRPGSRELHLALAIGVVAIAGVIVVAPFAAESLARSAAIAPAYEAWSILCALITTLMLLGQVAVTRSGAFLILAAGYLLTAVVSAVAFPGVTPSLALHPDGPLGAGAWLSLGRGAILPAFVIVYGLGAGTPADGGEHPARRSAPGSRRVSVMRWAATGLILGAGVLPLLALGLQASAGAFPSAARGAPLGLIAAQGVAILGLLALAALAARRLRTRVDLWLAVAVLASLGGLVLACFCSHAPYDLGWYMGIAYGAAASGALLIALLLESAGRLAGLAEIHEALLRSNKSLEHLSLHDALTTLANRRHFDAYLARQTALTRRHHRDLALVLCDLDDFKTFNDHFGHQAGDECLTRVAEAIGSCCRRPGDLAARYGGEEFALILPETDLAGAVQMAEAAREAVARLAIRNAPSATHPTVTLSGGVAILEAEDDGAPESLVAGADAALFEAKRRGRDRIVSTGPMGFIV